MEVRDGTAERLSGDPAHPFTRGTLCAKVNHYLERVYHPDRVLHPLKRAGRKGEGRFVRVSWDEALADIASRWHAMAAESGAEAILPYSSAGTQGLIQMASLDRRLFGSMGCSGLDRKICGAVAAAGLSATLGCGTGIDPEAIVHSRFIVLWGTNTIVTNLHFWPLVREAQRRGAKIVVVDPIRTRTAEAADWHLQIKPASDAALALAMTHVMIRDGLVDHDYVSQHAIGYDALADRARQYSPEQVSPTVGLPVDEIERFAREYATTQPSLLRPLIGMEHHRNGAMQLRTLACLPVLSGAWKHRGGGLARSTHVLQFAALDMDRVLMPDVYQPGVRVLNMRDLGNDLCSREMQPPVRSLIVYGSNPMVSMPDQGRIREGLLREDLFTVVHDLFVTDTALYADYVLPATSQIEPGPVARLGPSLSRLESAGHCAARGIGGQHRIVPTAGPGLGPDGRVAVRKRRIDAASGACDRAPVARRDHVRAFVGTRLRAVELPGGLAAVRQWRLRDPVGKGGTLFRATPRAGARSAAVGGRDPGRRWAATDHGQIAALPQFRIQQHGASSASRGGPVHRAPPRRRADTARGHW
ncbi:MAG: molybdopterin-dependent oxidoreductase [Acidobacteria bacterium]|nr:molybdopterin-dependent oxidoreductase [Acidobacteriota bacterium]